MDVEPQVDHRAFARQLRRSIWFREQEVQHRTAEFEVLWGCVLLVLGSALGLFGGLGPLAAVLLAFALVGVVLVVKARLFWWLYTNERFAKRQLVNESLALFTIMSAGIVLHILQAWYAVSTEQYWPILTLLGLAYLTSIQRPFDKITLQRITAWLLLLGAFLVAVQLRWAGFALAGVSVLGLAWLARGWRRGAFEQRRAP